MTRWPALLASALLLLPGCTAAGASDPMSKVSADLAQLSAGQASSNDWVLIDAVASGDVNVLKADLEALGMREAVAFGRIVSGRLPISAIRALDGLASLQFARPAHATTHPGAIRPGS